MTLKAYVDFRMPVLFVKEVQACLDEIEDGIVRVTKFRKRDRTNHHRQHLFVVATTIHKDQVLRLRFAAGTTQGTDQDKDVEKKADDVEAGLIKDLEAAGATIRGGVITALVSEAAA